MKFFENGDGVTEPRGFFASGVHCDVKGKKDGALDLGVIYSETMHGSGSFHHQRRQGGSRHLLHRPFEESKVHFPRCGCEQWKRQCLHRCSR